MEPNLQRSVEPFGEVHGVSDLNLLRIYLVSPHLEMGKRRLPIDRGKRSIDSIQAMRELDATSAWDIKAGIEDEPPPSQVNFAISMKVLRMIRDQKTNIWKMT